MCAVRRVQIGRQRHAGEQTLPCLVCCHPGASSQPALASPAHLWLFFDVVTDGWTRLWLLTPDTGVAKIIALRDRFGQ
jgi:hypothetical protein